MLSDKRGELILMILKMEIVFILFSRNPADNANNQNEYNNLIRDETNEEERIIMDRWDQKIKDQDEKLDVVNGLLEELKVVNLYIPK